MELIEGSLFTEIPGLQVPLGPERHEFCLLKWEELPLQFAQPRQISGSRHTNEGDRTRNVRLLHLSLLCAFTFIEYNKGFFSEQAKWEFWLDLMFLLTPECMKGYEQNAVFSLGQTENVQKKVQTLSTRCPCRNRLHQPRIRFQTLPRVHFER
jgi:hypothetical protein